MHLVIHGPNGSVRTPWSSYAALRDNIQHHLEAGAPGNRFQALHGLELAVDRGVAEVDAARLRGEVLRAWYALRKLPQSESAVSLRTRVIMTGASARPRHRGTIHAVLTGWELPAPLPEGGALLGAAEAFVTAVLGATATAVDGDRLTISREGRAPRYAGAPTLGTAS
jgi:hypothetical protein